MYEEKTYYENGQLKTLQQYNEETGLKEGIQELYDSNGTLHVREVYQAGEREGPVEEYRPNGTLQIRTYHKGGLRHGLREVYDENSTLRFRETNELGENIIYEDFYEDGSLREILPKDGLYQMFYPNSGLIMKRVLYVDGKREGLYEEFDETGAKVVEATYLQGQLQLQA
jgi:antitoxin component YwqK of YwqJK toxin-antitoxin module